MSVGSLLGKPSSVLRNAGVAVLIATTVGVAALAGVISTGEPAAAAARRRPARSVPPTTAPRSTSPTTAAPQTTTSSQPAPAAGVTTTVPRQATTSTTRPPATTVTTRPASGPTTTAPAAPAGSVLFGAATDGAPGDLSGLNSFETHAGKKVSLYSYYQSFYWDQNFNASAATAVRNRGAVPMVTWEPFNPSNGVDQPGYSLAAIANGTHDAYLSRWATQIKTWGQPLWLRFAHEMNGDWYPWAEGVNGNAPGSYVAAWRHVHDVFANAGVTNVTWVWTPNVLIPGRPSYASLYPGDAYVDWVGLDGYNWGTSASWSSWQSPTAVFGSSLASLRGVTSRPIVIGETASAEVGGNKAQWVQQFFSMLSANPDIKAFVWFNFLKETDWRIESTPATQAAFAGGVADGRYRAG